MQGERAVVPIVIIPLSGSGEFAEQVVAGLVEGGRLAGLAEELSHEQRLGRHRTTHRLAGAI